MRSYLRAANVGWAGLKLDDVKSMNFSDSEMGIYQLSPGDVLLSEASGSPGEVGKPALWSGELDECAFQNTLIRIRPHDVDSLFLLHYFRYVALTGGFTGQARGVGIHHLGRARIARWLTPVPPPDEQRRIVDILEDHLSRLDAAETSFVLAQAKIVALRDAILVSALFADLAGEAGHGSQMRVGEVADVDSGPAFKSSLFGGPGEGTRLLRGDNIEPGSLRWGRTRSWPDSQLDGFEHLLVAEGDIILAMDRPVVSAGLKLARVTAADMPALLVQRVARIRPRAAVSGDFLHQILSSRHFIQQLLGNQVGTQIPHITLEAIREFAFVLPEPAIQIAIAKQVRAHVESSERVEHDIAVAATRSHSLRRALLSAAFTGRLTRRIADMERVEEMAGV
jgi:type I restriction enzyme S subunit